MSALVKNNEDRFPRAKAKSIDMKIMVKGIHSQRLSSVTEERDWRN